jgi:hypothetical protein
MIDFLSGHHQATYIFFFSQPTIIATNTSWIKPCNIEMDVWNKDLHLKVKT